MGAACPARAASTARAAFTVCDLPVNYLPLDKSGARWGRWPRTNRPGVYSLHLNELGGGWHDAGGLRWLRAARWRWRAHLVPRQPDDPQGRPGPHAGWVHPARTDDARR